MDMKQLNKIIKENKIPVVSNRISKNNADKLISKVNSAKDPSLGFLSDPELDGFIINTLGLKTAAAVSSSAERGIFVTVYEEDTFTPEMLTKLASFPRFIGLTAGGSGSTRSDRITLRFKRIKKPLE